MATKIDAFAVELKYVVEEVLGQSPGGPIMSALTEIGFTSMATLLTISKSDLTDLKYKNKDDALISLIKGDKGLLWTLKAFAIYQQRQGMTIHPGDWFNVSKDDFDSFRTTDAINTVMDPNTGDIL